LPEFVRSKFPTKTIENLAPRPSLLVSPHSERPSAFEAPHFASRVALDPLMLPPFSSLSPPEFLRLLIVLSPHGLHQSSSYIWSMLSIWYNVYLFLYYCSSSSPHFLSVLICGAGKNCLPHGGRQNVLDRPIGDLNPEHSR